MQKQGKTGDSFSVSSNVRCCWKMSVSPARSLGSTAQPPAPGCPPAAEAKETGPFVRMRWRRGGSAQACGAKLGAAEPACRNHRGRPAPSPMTQVISFPCSEMPRIPKRWAGTTDPSPPSQMLRVKRKNFSYYLKFEGRVAERSFARGEQRQILIAKTALEQHASHLTPTA